MNKNLLTQTFAPPRSVHDGRGIGVIIFGESTKGRLEGCNIARNGGANGSISGGADPLLVACW